MFHDSLVQPKTAKCGLGLGIKTGHRPKRLSSTNNRKVDNHLRLRSYHKEPEGAGEEEEQAVSVEEKRLCRPKAEAESWKSTQKKTAETEKGNNLLRGFV